MFLIFLGSVIIVAWVYILFLREWLDEHLQGTRYAWWHEQIEDKLWEKSRTILVARLYWVGGIVVLIHDLAAAAGVDWTPVTTEIGNLLPEKYRALAAGLILIFTGIAFTWLRGVTTKPLEKTGG